MLVFYGGRKTREPREKPSKQGENQQTQLHMRLAGMEPRPHWWEKSAHTTAPFLLPIPGFHVTSSFSNPLEVLV